MARIGYQRFAWVNYLACVWAALFAAPHIWWALGIPAGFPGGTDNHRLLMTIHWRYWFDVGVVLLSITAMAIALALVRPWGAALPRWMLRAAAWVASGMLGLRGLAGLIVDGWSDPVWWPTFLTGGVLFGSVAWLACPARITGSDGAV
ncbi:MAG: DUF3995 domain-containing protein [Gemmatimonadota bacterium]